MAIDNSQTVWALTVKANLKVKKRLAKEQAKADFEVQIKAREQDIYREAEMEFAGVIRQLVQSGMKGYDIRKNVLGTQDWGTWCYWRDLAGVQSDSEIQRTRKEEEYAGNKPYRIEDGVVIVTRNADGPVEEFRIEEVVGDEKRGYAFWPYIDGEDYDRMMAAFPEGIAAVSPFLKEAFAKYGDDMRDLVAEREED